MSAIDLTVFILYIIGISVFGGSFFRKNRDSKSFTLGDNNIPSWVISMSIFATFVSSISYLALPGNAYLTNWNAFVFSLSIPLAVLIAIKFFIPLYRRENSPSAYTYMERRFGRWAKIYVSACYLLTQVMRVGTILFLLALALNAITSWDLATVIIITGIVVTIYSVLGGIQAVLWTDAIQGIILIAGAIVCSIYLLFSMPEGPSQIFHLAAEHDKFSLGSFSLSLSEPTFWVVLVYGVFINLQNFGIDQNYVQRYMAAKSEKEAKRSALQGGLLYLPVSALFLFIGTSLFAYYNSYAAPIPLEIVNSADQVFPYFIVNTLPPGLVGLLVASIFAAGMSTISTSFNSSATVILTDYYQSSKKRELTESDSMRVLYISSAVIATLGIGIGLAMINVKSALDAWWKLASIFSGGMLGLFLLGAFSRRKNVLGAILGVVAGLFVILTMTFFNLYLEKAELAIIFHPYLSIVFGTTAVFLVGFILTQLLPKNKDSVG